MAQYTLEVPAFYIQEIRSSGYDSLVASTGLRVMNAEGALHHAWIGQSVRLGDYAAGGIAHPIPLRYDNVDVPGPIPDSTDGGAIYWTFLLVTSERAASPELVSALTEAAITVAGTLLGSENILLQVAGGLILGTAELVKLLDQGCDGVVAAQSWAMTDAELTASTSGAGQAWVSWQNYPGTDSPLKCGAPSNYDVGYKIVRTAGPGIEVPDLRGQPLTDAEFIVRQAGLQLRVRQEVIGRVEIETVVSQSPAPHTRVPPPTTIDVTVARPPMIQP
jgi:hypothetical protein